MPLHIYGFFTLDMAGVMVGCRADAYTCPAGIFGGASVELGNARQEAGGRPVSPWTGGGKRLQAAPVRRKDIWGRRILEAAYAAGGR